jgi:AraC-like DNA-binding protein
MRLAGLKPFVEYLRRTGASVERLLSRATLGRFVSPEGLIPVSQVLRFMNESAQAGRLPNLGLLAGRDTPIGALGMFGRSIAHSRTLGEAIQTAIRAMPAFDSGGRYVLTRHGERARLSHGFVDGVGAGREQAEQYWLMLTLNIVRLAVVPARPDLVHLETVERGETAVTFPQALLACPLATTHGSPPLDRGEFESWSASGPADDFAGSVLQVIEALSSPELPRIGVTADAIGMSVRGLQRRLAEAGLGYQRLVGQARFATALHLLEGTNARVLDIALDLGYSDHAHFTRAFRRWTGVAPRDFRRMSRTGRGRAPDARPGEPRVSFVAAAPGRPAPAAGTPAA